MGNPTKELRTRLDEMGIAWVATGESMTEYVQEAIVYRAYEVCDGLHVTIVTPVTPEQAIAATVGRSCASCPEMDNPDSYISHIHAALEWHDEHVPRPTDPRNTCVVLEGEKLPEEVLFIGPNGVTHYLPEGEGTCVDEDSDPNDFKCSACGARSYIQANDTYTTVLDDHVTILKKFNYCPNCGKRIVKEGAE